MGGGSLRRGRVSALRLDRGDGQHQALSDMQGIWYGEGRRGFLKDCQRIYGPGNITSRKATCPDCKKPHTYYGQSRGGRKRCHTCAGDLMIKQVWIGAWRRFGETVRQ